MLAARVTQTAVRLLDRIARKTASKKHPPTSAAAVVERKKLISIFAAAGT